MQTLQEKLAQAAQEDPGLAPYFKFQSTLLHLLQETQDEIKATLELADEGALRAHLNDGTPLIGFDQLPIESSRYARLVGDIAAVLRDFEIEMADESLPEEPAALIALARERFETGRQEGTGDREPPERRTLAQLATGLALRPFLHWAADLAAPHVKDELWKRGYCPVCGGAPDMATLDEETGARHLICSRCDSQWSYRRVGCPFCSTTDHTLISYYPSEDEVYRLYVCANCRRYLKTIDLRKAEEPPSLPFERFATVALDAAAQEEGYR